MRRSLTIEASKKVNTTDDKIKALENKLETLKDISEPSRQQLEELADLENQIHSHYENKTDAARLRAKVDWYEKGEQSTKYFFNLERKNGQNKLWQKIRGLDGNLKYDIDEIKVITKLPNSEQSYKGKVQTHNYINIQNQSTTRKL